MYGHNQCYSVTVMLLRVICRILNDICMKHGETLKTKNSGTNKTMHQYC